MNIFAQAGVPVRTVKDLSPIPPELELFARIEGLVGEEAALLAIPREERKRKQRDRLREISAELDRIWDKLQQRAKHLPLDHDSSNTSGDGGARARHGERYVRRGAGIIKTGAPGRLNASLARSHPRPIGSSGPTQAGTPRSARGGNRQHEHANAESPDFRMTTTQLTVATDIDRLCADTIRMLSIDAVQQANSGHRGTPMALAPIGRLRAYGWTFLVFSDYMRGSMRLAALMGVPSIRIATGSEVHICARAADLLEADGIATERVADAGRRMVRRTHAQKGRR